MTTNASKMKLWAWLNLALFAIMVAVNYSGAAGLINGMSQKAVSAMFGTLITPAGFAFAIWGVIYALLFVLIVQLIVKHKQSNYALLIKEISPLFWLSICFNIAWTIAFSYLNMALALVFILLLLLSLKRICLNLVDNKRLMMFCVPSIGFGLYAGWVTVASVVNFAALMVQIKWEGFGLEMSVWAMIMLLAALLLVTAITLKIKNITYLLGVLWAFFAIFMAHKSPVVFADKYGNIQNVLLLGMVYLALMTIFTIYRKARA